MSETDRSTPPKGITANRDTGGDQTVHEIVLTAPRYRYWISGLALGVPALAILISLLDSDTWWLGIYVAIMELGMAVVFLPDLLKKREIEVNHGYMTLTDYARYVGPKSETVSISEITGMEIRGAHLNVGQEIVVEADGETYRLGAGLSKEALAWLRDYLNSAIREASTAEASASRVASRIHRVTPAPGAA